MDFFEIINEESKKEYFIELQKYVKNEYENNICHPLECDIYNAFKYCSFKDTKVIILGQDPYHNFNQAHGLSFSVNCEKLPPSLKNIYKEMSSDLGVEINQDGNLEYLANQGVLLLNTILTVRHNTPLSHAKKGWEIFSDRIISLLDSDPTPKVFVLWGNPSIKKKILINNPNHLIIESSHPSPLGAYRGFIGSKPFSKINEFLISNDRLPIKWYK